MATTSPTALFSPEERRIIHFTGVAHGATHYVELVYPTLAVGLASETGIALEQVLSWSFAGYLLFGLGALPAGFAADRFGGRRVILAGLLVSGLSAVLAGFARPGWPLALCLAGLGLGASCYHPAGTGLLSRAVRARGRALGINGIYGNAGIALCPLLTASLSGWLGWRWTISLTGAALVLLSVAFGRLRITEPGAVARPVNEPGIGISRKQILAFSVLCGTAMLGGISYRGNTLAQPAFFAEQIDFLGYGAAVSLVMLAGLVGQYVGGLIADRRDPRWGYFAFHLASLPFLICVTLVSGLPLLLASGLFVFFALGMQPIENTLYAQLTPERWRSTAYGLKFVLTFGVGASAVGLARWVAESHGWVGVYQVLAAVVALLVIGALVLIRVTRSDPVRA